MVSAALLEQLNRLYRAGPDIDTNQVLSVSFFEHDLFNPRDIERADAVLLTETSASLKDSDVPALAHLVVRHNCGGGFQSSV